MIGNTQPEMELLEVVTFIYLFLLKAGSPTPSSTRIEFFNAASLDFMCSSELFLKKSLAFGQVLMGSQSTIIFNFVLNCLHSNNLRIN